MFSVTGLARVATPILKCHPLTARCTRSWKSAH